MRNVVFCLQFAALATFFALVGHRVLPVASGAPSTDQLEASLAATTVDFHQDLAELEAAIRTYHQALIDGAASGLIRDHHVVTRLAFKRVEYLLEYIDPTSVKRYLNGAPLPKTEPKVPEVVVIEPSGLQVLDELVFAEELDRTSMRYLTEKLLKEYLRSVTYARNQRLQHKHIFEAIRLELIRIFTLGVTGFDTPGSVNGLPESIASTQTIAQTYGHYAAAVREIDPKLDDKIQANFAEAQRQLEAGDFDTFDRLHFLRTVINPLTASLTRAQDLLNIEFSEKATIPGPLNFRAEQLFDEDWLNAATYARLSPTNLQEQRAALGELLFFDPILSINNQRACASCHNPDKAFTDGYAKSLALDGKGTIKRNSPTLINCVYTEKFFSDLREEKLERQIKHVVLDSLEFGTDFVAIVEKLNQSKEYRELFASAYSDHPKYSLSRWSVSDALGHYILGLRTHNSAFDQMARGEIDVDPEVAKGFNLFMGKAACGTCHFAPTFNGLVPPYYRESESEVLGVPKTAVTENAEIDPDLGRVVNAKPQDEAYFHAFSFKTPTVRNAALTAPYMHNGVYNTLPEVMEFYNLGGGAGIGSYVEHQTLPPDPLGLDEPEIAAIITFMEALTDTTGMNRIPTQLPKFEEKPEWNKRTIGGDY